MAENFNVENNRFRGSISGNGVDRVPLPVSNAILAERLRKQLPWISDAIPVNDPQIDYVWGAGGAQRPPISYYDYYFTGQDIKVFIDGADEPGMELPLQEFGFNVQQQKKPLYGFWSYNWDAIMRGTRIVAGSFSVVTRYPNLMTDLLSLAAETRQNQKSTYHIRGLDKDETNIQQYWQRNLEDTNGLDTTKNMWSVHPPFNFVVNYGIQSPSITKNAVARQDHLIEQYRNDTAMYTNDNERLVEADATSHSMRILVENVELLGCQIQFTPDGSPCLETYSFIARDLVYPRS